MARMTLAANRRSPACSGRSSDSLLKPRLDSRSASDWMSRIVIVFASAMTDASPSVVVRAAAGVSRTDGGPPRGVRGRHGIASSPSDVEFLTYSKAPTSPAAFHLLFAAENEQ